MANQSLFVKSSPFPATPDPRRYIPLQTTEQARVRLMRSIDRDEGPAVLIGPTGTGKTLVCQTLAAAYRNAKEVVLLNEAKICTRRALLQTILFHLDMEYRERSEGELRLSLLDRLRPTENVSGRDGLLLIVDEAQTLSIKLIDELRMIAGVVRDGRPRVHLVLSGNMRLEERLSDPALEVMAQRIGARCYLHPFHLDETREYIREHIRRAGVQLNEVIDESAIYAVHQAANGIPRVISQLMDQAVFSAESRGAARIDLRIVESAWAELNQLPTPYVDIDVLPNETDKDATVEFGALDDEGEEAAFDDETHATAYQVESPVVEPFADNELGRGCAKESLPPSACDASLMEEGTDCKGQHAVANKRSKNNGFSHTCVNAPSSHQVRGLHPHEESAASEALASNHAAFAFSLFHQSPAAEALEPEVASNIFIQGSQNHPSFVGPTMLSGDLLKIYSSNNESHIAKVSLENKKPTSAFVDRVSNPIGGDKPGLSSFAPFAESFSCQPSSSLTAGQIFGDDFDEEVFLNKPLGTSGSNGPLSSEWKQDLVEIIDTSEQEDGIHQEVLSIGRDALPFAFQDVSIVDEIFEIANGSKLNGDDRDLLIIGEEIVVSNVTHTQMTPGSAVNSQPILDYRTLFSRLRQG